MRTICKTIGDIHDKSTGATILFIGQTGSGKSILIKDFLMHHSYFRTVVCISPTESLNRTYSAHIPAITIHDKFSSLLIEKVIQRQKDIVDRCENDPAYENADPRCLIIMDDIMDDTSWIKDEGIQKIFYSGRHYRITLLVALQYALGIPIKLRTNIDYVFFTMEPKRTNVERYNKHYVGIIKKFDKFADIFYSCVENFGALVLDCHPVSSKVEDSIFWYRADYDRLQNSHFRLCNGSVLWKKNALVKKIQEKRRRDELEQIRFRKTTGESASGKIVLLENDSKRSY